MDGMKLAVPEWIVAPGLTPYPQAVAAMEAHVAAIAEGQAAERIWLVEHPPLYTAGTSASDAELLDPHRFPVFRTGRGGRHTYHGPGQRVVYGMLDVGARGRDVRAFVAGLEDWIVAALDRLGIAAFTVPGKTGVWVATAGGAAKIAAIGVRLRRWVSYHGFAINVAPDLDHFGGIVPCGLSEPVTSVAALGGPASLDAIDSALAATLPGFLAGLAGNVSAALRTVHVGA
jgi:lipoyl(octanoyl) transferase